MLLETYRFAALSPGRNTRVRSGSTWLAAVLACVALIQPAPAAAADGKALYATCAACHGARGEGNAKIGAPNIAGMDVWYLERQLDNFAAGRRGTAATDTQGMQMKAAVAALPGVPERQAVAAYVAAMPQIAAGSTAPVKGAGKPDLNNGKTQYNSLCTSCHQANGAGNKSLGAPRLAGVDPTYIARQLANFRAGARGAHPDDKTGKQMAAISKLLADPAAERDTLAYIATLKP